MKYFKFALFMVALNAPHLYSQRPEVLMRQEPFNYSGEQLRENNRHTLYLVKSRYSKFSFGFKHKKSTNCKNKGTELFISVTKQSEAPYKFSNPLATGICSDVLIDPKFDQYQILNLVYLSDVYTNPKNGISKVSLYVLTHYVDEPGGHRFRKSEAITNFKVDFKSGKFISHDVSIFNENTEVIGSTSSQSDKVFPHKCGEPLMAVRLIPGKDGMVFIYKDPAVRLLNFSNRNKITLREVYTANDRTGEDCKAYGPIYYALRSDKKFERLFLTSRFMQYFHFNEKKKRFDLFNHKF